MQLFGMRSPLAAKVSMFQQQCRAVLLLQVVVVWNTAQVTCGGDVVVLAKAHTDVDIQTLKIAFFDDTR